MVDKKRSSIVAPYIDGMLAAKHANGYRYESEELVLNRFDRYCIDRNLDTLEITRDFLADWMKRQEAEGDFNQGKRISCVRQLLLYMASCGLKVYIPHDFCHFKKALPHIFDPMELAAFFHAVDSWQPTGRPALVRLRKEYMLIFRLYCCCGMRNSEVVGIRTENVDLTEGSFTIIDGKGNKDRVVYLPEDLHSDCIQYYGWLCGTLGFQPEWFFPAQNCHCPLKNTTMDSVFTRFWCMTPYAGCSNKPTIHDFRFTFVVNRMNTWAENGMDLKVMMPYLSRYLGHKSTDETFYYYHLVSDAYKTVRKLDTIAGNVIPEVKDHEF